MTVFNWTPDTPIPEAVGQAMGFASLCWSPRPTGVFQADECKQVLEELLEFLQSKSVGL